MKTALTAGARSSATRALRPAHHLTLLKGGEHFFPALIEAIEAARAEVLLETYMFDFGRSVLPVAGALESAARRGVTVRVVVDGVGTGDVPAEWQRRWTSAGAQWVVFNPARGWRVVLPKRWRRLHRKLCVVDGSVGFCGGINLLDDHYDPNHGVLEQPRFDFAVRVVGPLVADMHGTMTRLWARSQVARQAQSFDVGAAFDAVISAAHAGTDMHDEGMKSEIDRDGRADPVADGGVLAALVLRDNLRFRRSIEGNYRLAIASAKSEIVIANAYFVPGVSLQRALIRAAERGVKVTLLLQGKYEYFMQFHASRAVYGAMLRAGIEIIEYAESFLHAKVAVMDADGGDLAIVGSSNLDPLSLLLAREANVFVRDDGFAAELRGHLQAAIASGRRVDPASYMRRPLLARGLNWVAYAMMRVALFATGNRY
jgi:cardiolipin synthase